MSGINVIKKILLAVDLGIHTPHLLQHAASLSNQYRASMVVVHAVEPLGTLGHALLQTYLKPETSKALTTTGMDSIVEQIRSRVIDILTDEYMAGDMELPRLEGVIVRPGAPVEVITEVAEEIHADVIILGSHAPEMTGAHLGTVSQRVLACSKWPVFLVPHAQPIWQQQNTGKGPSLHP
jgi:nucleotide-binding universal stress UspA family protein